ncbi:hypothetical protein DSECCO2_450130 [anaerobic digester metagenome]
MLINYITKYRMKKILLLLFMLTLTMATFSQSKTSKQKYDTEYWDSVNREKRLKKAGLKEAAKKEGKYRRDRMQGKTKGEYTNKKGEDTRIYKGSKEQKKDLEEIDKYFNKHGWN